MRITLLTASLMLGLSADPTPAEAPAASDARRTGRFQLTLTLTEIAGADSARAAESVIPPDEPVTWELYVPDSYRPEKPAGLMVYISPSPSGAIPRGWGSVMDRRNLLWIAANDSGNKIAPARRALYALVAPTLAGNRYEIDPERIYVSGLSGGGRMAGMVAADYPHLFKGAIYSCGIDPWDRHPPERFELFKQNRFVFVTGTRDFALERTRRVHRQYLKSGIANSKLMVIRDMAHRNPDARDLDTAIQFLDAAAKPTRLP